MTIIGGAGAENPIYVTVLGQATVTGTIMINSGYVVFQPEEQQEGQSEAILQAGGRITMLEICNGADVTMNGITLKNDGGYSANGMLLTNISSNDPVANNVTLNDCVIDGFSNGSGVINNFGTVTIYGGTIRNCGNGLDSNANKPIFHLYGCTVTGNNHGLKGGAHYYIHAGTSITGNTTAGFYYTNKMQNVYLDGEGIEVEKMDLGQGTVNVAGPVGGSIEVTNASGYGVIATGTDYTLTDNDAQMFHYTPTQSQLNGNVIYGQPYLDDSNNKIVIDLFYKQYIPYEGVIGDLGYILRPATEDGLNEDYYQTGQDENGFYYAMKEGEAYFRIDVKKGYDASGLAATFNGDPVTLYTADELMAASGKTFTPAVMENIDMSRYFVITVGAENHIEVSGVTMGSLEGVAQIAGSSLTLTGEIGVNIFLTIPDEVLDDAGAYATLNGKKVLLKDITPVTQSGMQMYKFSCYMAAKKMNDPVVLKLYDGNNDPVSLYSFAGDDITDTGYSCCVQDYIQRVESGYIYEDNLKALMGALSDYGSLSQILFNYKTDEAAELVNAEAIDAVTEETLEPMTYTITGPLTDGRITYEGSTMILESKTTLKHFYSVGDGYAIGDFVFQLDNGIELVPVKSGNYYYVEIPDIVAKDLNRNFTVHVSLAEDEEAYSDLSYSALSYAKQTLKHMGDNEALQHLVKGMYIYSLAADAYFEQ